MLDRMMARFSRWFASTAGTWQTLVAVLAWVIVEQINPHLDPHGFVLLYVLTVYSGVTQPALAYGAAQAALEASRSADAQEQLLRNQVDTMRAVQAILLRLEGAVEQVQEHVEDLVEAQEGEG